MKVFQLVYYSRNTITKSSLSALDTLRSIVSVSQANNKRDGITGYLIFDRACFLQILEGDKAHVYSTYRRIEGDPRHADVVIVGAREVSVRLFPNWTMAGALRTFDQEEIFLRHGIGNTIVPSRLKADTVVALAKELMEYHAETKVGAVARQTG